MGVNYTVIWQPVAEKQLATAWIDATDRWAVTRAGHHVDALLGVDPAAQGESRGQGRRVVFVPPLVVTFEIIEDDRQVRILRVRPRERPPAAEPWTPPARPVPTTSPLSQPSRRDLPCNLIRC